MKGWGRAIPVVLVALLVVAACAVSLAQAADTSVHVCDATKGWRPAKTETGQSTSLLLGVAAVPVGSIQPVLAASASVGLPDWLALVVERGPAHPLASRAPPFA